MIRQPRKVEHNSLRVQIGRLLQSESASAVLPIMNYSAVLTFVLPLLCLLTISGAQPQGDGRFRGGFNGEEPMNHPHPRGFGVSPKSEFFRICSPWRPFGRWWLPEFLKNVSTEGMNNFCDIVRNENLTKAETEQQLDQWAQDQEGDIYEKFNNYMEQRKQMRENVQQKIQELIANVSKFIDDEQKILNDTSLTGEQEKEQLVDLTTEAGWAVVRLAHMIRKEAGFLAGEHRRGPCPPCGSMFPPMPPPFPSMPRPFPQHGFGFGPDMHGRGSRFLGDDGEPFGPYGLFNQDELFEQNELHGAPEHNGPFAA